MIKLLFYLIIFFVASASSKVIACTCLTLEPLKRYDNTYDVIFVGTAIADSDTGMSGTVTFRIDSLFKGVAPKEVKISYDNQSSCMMNFHAGERWIICANYTSYGQLSTNICSHSRPHPGFDRTKDYYADERGTSFNEDLKMMSETFGIQKISVKNADQFPPRQLEHPDRGTSFWWMIASIPILLFFYWLVRRFLK